MLHATTAPRTPTTSSVRFSSTLVTAVEHADEIDRTPTVCDRFSCDVCQLPIPCGLRGFEPYSSCLVSSCSGFDVCAVCLPLPLHRPAYLPSQRPLQVTTPLHLHHLSVIDRESEVAWSNESASNHKSKRGFAPKLPSARPLKARRLSSSSPDRLLSQAGR